MQRVAVIGAGAAGLAAAVELRREGLSPVVFEQGDEVGGIWRFTEAPEHNRLGVDLAAVTGGTFATATSPAAAKTQDEASVQAALHARVHSSLYASLRTNLPRDLMAFTDFPFDSSGGGDDDWPRFPHHAHVFAYLQRYADAMGVRACIRFGTRVHAVRPAGDAFTVTTTTIGHGSEPVTETFAAVVVCNGHYSEPRVPALPGLSTFPGALWHAHNYRRPEPFRSLRVALLGTGPSGVDLTMEIANVARDVFWCGRAFDALPADQRQRGNVHRLPEVEALGADGRVHCRGGIVTAPVDAFVFCTGYRYSYPFLADDVVSVRDNFVSPLYQDVLHVELPSLAFIGVPFRVVPFPLFAVQARWFARLLAGRFVLPTAAQRRRHQYAAVAALRASGLADRHLHQRSIDCHDYLDALADECGAERMPSWHRQQARAFLDHAAANAGRYRDVPLPHFAPTRVPAASVASK